MEVLVASKFQRECQSIEKDAAKFFDDDQVLERLSHPATYFTKISTVAFKPVSSRLLLCLCLRPRLNSCP